jgi:hypothetical protein
MFEKFKEELMNKIERNSIKSELSWVDKEGNTHTEIAYLKRGRGLVGDWHRIYLPVKEDGKWDIPNLLFGGRKNFIRLLFWVAFATLLFLAYKEQATNYMNLRNLPCVTSCLTNFYG